MPFTLAHPALILPLRSRWASAFIALVVGSVAPDLPYFLPGQIGPRLPNAHALPGMLSVGLPLGLAVLAVLAFGREIVVAPLWEPHRTRLHAALERLRHSPVAWAMVVPGLLVGICLHLLWDAFTHRSGWFATHIAALERTVYVWPGYNVEGFRVLQYVSSIVGVFVLIAWYARRLREHGAAPATERPGWRSWAVFGLYLLSWLWGFAQVRRIGLQHTSIHGATYVAVTAELACFALLYLVLGAAVHGGELWRRARAARATAPAPP